MRIACGGFVLVLAAALAAPAWSSTQTYFGFHIGITNAPPPPVVFYDEPVISAVPGHPVYAVDGCPYDMFRYGPSWYLFDAGFWYRAHSYSGPFVAVDVRYVPRPVLYVPVSHWKHRYYGRSWDQGRGYGGRYRGGYRDREYYGRSWEGNRGYRGEYRGRGYDGRNGRARGRSWQGRGSSDGEWRYGPVADAQYRDYGGVRSDRGRGYSEGKGSKKGKHNGGRKHRDRDD